MQPSSDQPTEGASPLRRWGPIAAIVAAIALVGVVVFTGGDDDDPGESTADTAVDTSDTTGADEGPERPEGAISFTDAEEEGLDVTFPETCDLERGRVAIPFFFAPECFAEAEDNGGATAQGVTEDTITVVYYSAPESDPVLDFITGPIANDDTPAEIQETVKGYAELFNTMYQTYGRTVKVEVLEASGGSTNEVAARADAVRAIEQYKPFAVWGGPTLSNAWTDEIAANGVVCVSCPAGSQQFAEERSPYVYSVGMSGSQINVHAAEYVAKRLAGEPAEHAGDEAMHGTERVFGHLYITSSEESERNAAQFRELLSAQGVELAEQVGYQLDPGRLAEQANNVIAKFKAAGVTSVLLQADPVAPANFTQEATNQEYFPEWVVAGGALVDTAAFGRVYDQQQWQNAFGVTSGSVRIRPELGATLSLYNWFFGEDPPAADTAPVLYPTPALFFAALQQAGPILTPESFRDGLFGREPTPNAITAPSLSYGDHGFWENTPNDWYGVDDATEIWWDPDAEGPDEIRKDGVGLYQYTEGGKRYYPGDWTEETTIFDPAESVTILQEPPESETPPAYERP